MAELSIVSVVLFIASGGLVFILLFLFAKRQITRFTLKSARRPHVNIGTDAPKIMRQEIKRRLDRVEHFMYEPVLLTEKVQIVASSVPNHYYYRMKALDAYTNAIESLRENEPTMEMRHPTQTILQYLFSLCPSAITGPAHKSDILHRFADGYVQARHDPAVFEGEQFINYMELLDQVIRLIKQDADKRSSTAVWFSKNVKDTEVVYQPGKKGFEDGTVTVQASKSHKDTEPKTETRNRRPDSLEHINLVDSGKSSGYSSTDRSSSSRGSVEKLIPVREAEKEDPV
ncbi:protein C1orf43 homolog [Haliotis asinina]|uniref:protein C1orf43 homolog n=1 Tax=Haliotis asinina TaxID=109174 RepID=UPI003531FF73